MTQGGKTGPGPQGRVSFQQVKALVSLPLEATINRFPFEMQEKQLVKEVMVTLVKADLFLTGSASTHGCLVYR